MKEKTVTYILGGNLICWLILLLTEFKFEWISALFYDGNPLTTILAFILAVYIFPLGGVYLWIFVYFLDYGEESKEDQMRRIIKEELENVKDAKSVPNHSQEKTDSKESVKLLSPDTSQQIKSEIDKDYEK